jgi:hypothetical protein
MLPWTSVTAIGEGRAVVHSIVSSAAPATNSAAAPAMASATRFGEDCASASIAYARSAATIATASETRNTPPTGANPASVLPGSCAWPTASHGKPVSTKPRSHSASVHAPAAATKRAAEPAGATRATAQPASAGHSAR